MLAEMCGLFLDPWQELALEETMWIREDNTWSASEVAIEVGRQNGKGAILEARQLWGLVLGQRRMIHTAHEFKTAEKHFLRLLQLLQFDKSVFGRVKQVHRANGKQAIEMHNGSRIDFIARSKGSGRGLSGDDLFLDENMILPPLVVAALLPLVSASPNPQIISSGSIPFEVTENSEYIRKLRRRSLTESPGRLVWLEWSAPQQDLQNEPEIEIDLDDQQNWIYANPALGYRLDLEFMETERGMPDALFAVERLGIWPDDSDDTESIGEEWWRNSTRTPTESMPLDPISLAVDISPLRDTASLAIAGWSTHPPIDVVDRNTGEIRSERPMHAELIDKREGTGWLINRIVQVCADNNISSVVLDPASPAGTLIIDLENEGIEVNPLTQREVAQACGLVLDLVRDGLILHLDDPELDASREATGTRPLAGGIGWKRRTGGDITAFCAMTFAVRQARLAESSASKPVFAY